MRSDQTSNDGGGGVENLKSVRGLAIERPIRLSQLHTHHV